MKYVRPLCFVALIVATGLLMQACVAYSAASATVGAASTVVGTGAKATKAAGRAVF